MFLQSVSTKIFTPLPQAQLDRYWLVHQALRQLRFPGQTCRVFLDASQVPVSFHNSLGVSMQQQKEKNNFSKMTKDQLVKAREKVYMDECELHDNELECREACGRKYFPAFAWSLTHCKVIHVRPWIKALCPQTQPPFETHIHKTGIAQWARPALLLFLPLAHPQPRAQPLVTTRSPAFDSHAMEQKG